MQPELQLALSERFYAVNGRHPMTAEDDAYVTEWYAPLEDVAASEGWDVDELARLMLAGSLPIPGYIRSDGTMMVGRDLLALANEAGGVAHLPAWFGRRFESAGEAVDAWDGYLKGHWVCLREVTPAGMRRQEELVAEIERRLAQPKRDGEWRRRLEALVDELDALEPPFAPYDRLRFGGPVSRDRFVDAAREQLHASPSSGADVGDAALDADVPPPPEGVHAVEREALGPRG